MFHFVRSIPFCRPRFIPLVVQGWIVGLSMRDWVERNSGELRAVARPRIAGMDRSFHNYVQRGTLEWSLGETRDVVTNLSFSMRGWLDLRFFRLAAHHIERPLERTSVSVTLRVEALHDAHRGHLRRLLKRLTRCGDRIHMSVHDELRDMVHIESSVFNVMLEY